MLCVEASEILRIMEATIGMTDAAREKILQTATAEHVDMKASQLRIAVVPGGCSGLTYELGWDTTVQESDVIEEVRGIRVLVDQRSAAYLAGSTLDFSDGLEGRGFHFHNPQAIRNCACGESVGL